MHKEFVYLGLVNNSKQLSVNIGRNLAWFCLGVFIGFGLYDVYIVCLSESELVIASLFANLPTTPVRNLFRQCKCADHCITGIKLKRRQYNTYVILLTYNGFYVLAYINNSVLAAPVPPTSVLGDCFFM